MKKSKDKNEGIKEYLMPTIILVLICLIVTFALDTTYRATEPIIKIAAEKEAEKARNIVLPESEGFEMVASVEKGSSDVLKLKNNVVDVYKANNASGFVITTTDKGYGGKIKVITGFSKEGLINNILLLEHKETPGLGTKVGEPKFIKQFIGKDSVDSVDAISSVTISSNAMKRAVNSALDQMETIKEGGL